MVHTHSVAAIERAKYESVWQNTPEYRDSSPAERLLGPFLALTGLKPGHSVIDVGCGSGRASVKLAQLLVDVRLIDVTREALDPEAQQLPFLETCLWSDWPSLLEGSADYVLCCDVMEHIPTEFAMLVVARCLHAAQTCFFHIDFDADAFGPRTIGSPLHLTQRSFCWWRDRLGELGQLSEARDLIGHGLFLLRRHA